MKQSALCILGFVALVAPIFAHHSAAAEYDIKSTIMVKGTVTNVEWTNPHVRFYVDVKGEDSKVVNWEFESASPNQLARSGWTRSIIKVGDVVTVEAYRAKDGANLGDALSVTTAEGRKLTGSTSTGEGR